jgi:hypothetical protein
MTHRTLQAIVGERPRVTATAEWANDNPNMTDMPRGSSHWRVTLRYRGRRMTVPFSQGPAICAEPTAADVLGCLLTDSNGAEQTFEDWCAEYGYDTDSRKAERTWRAVVRQSAKLQRLLREDYARFSQAEW